MKRLWLAVVVALLGLAVPVSADPTDCNALVSMSQGAQVYNGSNPQSRRAPLPSGLEAATGEQWMLLLKGGKALKWWTVPANWNTLEERDRCAADAEIVRIVFLFDPHNSNMPVDLATVEDIVASRYPNAEFVPVLLVGAEGHVICTVGGHTVRASATHAAKISQLPTPDLDVPCSGYADQLGHLTPVGADVAQGQLAAYFAGG